MGLQRFPIGDFRGGMNLVDGLELAPDEVQDAKDIKLGIRGAVRQRGGQTRFDSGGLNLRMDHIRPWYLGSNSWVMVSSDGTVFSVTPAGTVTSRVVGTAQIVWDMEQMEYNPGAGYKDTLWMLNGVDAPKKWDGTTVAAWANCPLLCNIAKSWKNMMVVSGSQTFPQRVYFSDIANPESPAGVVDGGYGSRWIDVRTSEDDLDPVVALEVLGDVLLVFKRQSVHAVYDPTTFAFNRIANVGGLGRFNAGVLDDRCYFLNRTGLFSVTERGELRYESEAIEPLFTGDIVPGAFSLNPFGATFFASNTQPRCRVHVSKRRIYIMFGTTDVGIDNNYLFEGIPDLRSKRSNSGEVRMPWFRHTLAVADMCDFRAANTQSQLITAQPAAGKLHVSFSSSTTDEGSALITGRVLTQWKRFQTEEPYERLRRLNLKMSGKVTVDVYKDYDLTSVAYTGNLSASTTKPQQLRLRPETRARAQAFMIRAQSTGDDWTLHDLEAVIRGGKEH